MDLRSQRAVGYGNTSFRRLGSRRCTVNWEKLFLDSTLHFITERLNRYQHSSEKHKLCTETNILFEIWYCNIVSFLGWVLIPR